MATITLRYNHSAGGFMVVGAGVGFSADPDDFDGVADYLARSLCDNPQRQALMGVLGSRSFHIVRGADYKRPRAASSL